MHFYKLRGGSYLKSSSSRILPRLMGEILCEFIDLMKTQGSTKARHAFRRRILAGL
ncbi:hypothetical protein D3C83_119580 [compost metagenome]